jgi:hypothetical protein
VVSIMVIADSAQGDFAESTTRVRACMLCALHSHLAALH